MSEPTETPIDTFQVRDAETGQTFALRLGSDEQLNRLHADLYAQYQGYRQQAGELLSKAENALSGANLIAYELERRKISAALNGTEH